MRSWLPPPTRIPDVAPYKNHGTPYQAPACAELQLPPAHPKHRLGGCRRQPRLRNYTKHICGSPLQAAKALYERPSNRVRQSNNSSLHLSNFVWFSRIPPRRCLGYPSRRLASMGRCRRSREMFKLLQIVFDCWKLSGPDVLFQKMRASSGKHSDGAEEEEEQAAGAKTQIFEAVVPLHMGISICAFAHYIVRHFNEFKYKLLTSGLVRLGSLCCGRVSQCPGPESERERENVTQNHN